MLTCELTEKVIKINILLNGNCNFVKRDLDVGAGVIDICKILDIRVILTSVPSLWETGIPVWTKYPLPYKSMTGAGVFTSRTKCIRWLQCVPFFTSIRSHIIRQVTRKCRGTSYHIERAIKIYVSIPLVKSYSL